MKRTKMFVLAACGLAWACAREPAEPPPRLMRTAPSPDAPSAKPKAPTARPEAPPEVPTAAKAPRAPQIAEPIERPAPPIGSPANAEVDAHFRARDQLDATVWKHEVAAQRHERIFVELWDDLRTTDDPEAVLAEFPFDAITVARMKPAVAIAPDLERHIADGLGPEMGRSAWRAWLAAQREAGAELVHSEWHHARFEPAEGPKPAESRFKGELHVLVDGRRWRLKLQFDVIWARSSAEKGDGRHVPRRITVDAVDAVGQTGAQRFVELQSLAIGPHRPQPLIAADLDRDGRTELLAPLTNRRFVFDGERFAERPLARRLLPGANAAVLADLTGDGHPDLLATGRTTSADGERTVLALYRGGAGGVFDQPAEVVFDPPDGIRGIRVLTVGDIDGDGDLDVFAPQYRGAYNGDRMPSPFDDADDSWPAWLLRNEGGRFVDMTAESGLAPRQRHTQSASFFDADGDGDLDLLTVNDFAGVDLHRNDGQGRFTRDAEAFDNPTLFGMSHAFGDFDGDGLLDLFATGMNSTTVRRLNALDAQRPDKADYTRRRTEMTYGNRLYLGRPGGRFAMAPFAAEVQAAGWAWGVVAFDPENDGDLDLFAANGFISGRTAADYCTRYWSHDVYLDDGVPPAEADGIIDRLALDIESGISWNGFEHNKLFERSPEGFVETGFPRGLGGEADARNVIADDIDGDGRVDLVIAEAARGGLRARVMRNAAPAGRWIAFDLGAAGIAPWGARISLKTSTGTRGAAVVTGDSFAVQHRPRAHFGLAPGETVESVTVHWPGGRTTTLAAPAPDRVHRVAPPR